MPRVAVASADDAATYESCCEGVVSASVVRGQGCLYVGADERVRDSTAAASDLDAESSTSAMSRSVSVADP